MTATFAFYKGTGQLQDRLIRAVTRSPYSHIEILRSPLVNGGADCISASKRDGNCVRQKHITFAPEKWDFVTVQHLDAGDIWRHAGLMLGAPYDLIGAVMTVTQFHWRTADAIFCSELTATVCGLPDPHRWTPGSFHDWAASVGRETNLGDA